VNVRAILLQGIFDGLGGLLGFAGLAFGLCVRRGRGGHSEGQDKRSSSEALPHAGLLSHGSFVDRLRKKVP
jgi:hypothetical protein